MTENTDNDKRDGEKLKIEFVKLAILLIVVIILFELVMVGGPQHVGPCRQTNCTCIDFLGIGGCSSNTLFCSVDCTYVERNYGWLIRDDD